MKVQINKTIINSDGQTIPVGTVGETSSFTDHRTVFCRFYPGGYNLNSPAVWAEVDADADLEYIN